MSHDGKRRLVAPLWQTAGAKSGAPSA
jgi:hypothetical protein